MYPGTPLPKWPSETSRTNRHTLVHPCQSDPWRRHVPIGIPWYIPAKTTLRGITYQSTYPGTPLPKQPSEASRTNRRTLVHPALPKQSQRRTNHTFFLDSCHFMIAEFSEQRIWSLDQHWSLMKMLANLAKIDFTRRCQENCYLDWPGRSHSKHH